MARTITTNSVNDQRRSNYRVNSNEQQLTIKVSKKLIEVLKVFAFILPATGFITLLIHAWSLGITMFSGLAISGTIFLSLAALHFSKTK